MNSIKVLVCTFFMICLNLQAQDIPPIIPPSPTATSLAKYADVPVSLYTGIPDVSIPLYTIKIRDNQLPITLRYHSGGIRVEEEASWIGLGWSLEAGGVITRSVHGFDDLLNDYNYKGYPYTHNYLIPTTNPSGQLLFEACKGNIDTQPDIFSINVSGKTGKFYLKQKDSLSDALEIVMLSQEKMRINYNEQLQEWVIWTADGFRYEFKEKEYSHTHSKSGGSEDAVNDYENITAPSPQEPTQQEVITAWYLTKVVSPLGEVITFEYENTEPTTGKRYISESVVQVSERRGIPVANGAWSGSDMSSCGVIPYDKFLVLQTAPGYGAFFDFRCLTDNISSSSCSSIVPSYSFSYTGSKTIIKHTYLKRITFSNGHLEFNTSARSDIRPYKDGNAITYASPRKLSNIEVYQQGVKLRTLTMGNDSYFNQIKNTDETQYKFRRLKLSSLQESNGSESKSPYQFKYNDLELPAKDSKSRDHWGYYNSKNNDSSGPGGQPSLIPQVSFTNLDNNIETREGADRETNEGAAMASVLTKITYPTGGQDIFTFQSHTFNINQISTTNPTQDFLIPAQETPKVFDIKQATEVTINIELRCQSLSCTGGIGQQCDPSNIENVPYLNIKKLGGGWEYNELHADWYCMIDPTQCTEFIYSTTPCSITLRKKEFLEPGIYLVTPSPLDGFEAIININYSQDQDINTITQSSIVKAGGLRIHTITTKDGSNTNPEMVRYFQYHDITGQHERSYGRIMNFPKYFFGQFNIVDELNCNQSALLNISAASYSNVPLGESAQGSIVGYDQVIEYKGIHGEYGKIIHTFKNEPDEQPSPFLPNSPTITHAPSNGLLLSRKLYNRDGFKVHEINNNYHSVINRAALKGIQMHSSGCEGSYIDGFHYVYKLYSEPSEWWYLESAIEKVYDLEDETNGRAISTTTTYLYNNEHKQPTQIIHTDPEGNQFITRSTYPLDDTNAALDEMWDENNANYKHQHTALLKKEFFLKEVGSSTEKFLSGKKTTYDFVHNTIVPKAINHALQGSNYQSHSLYEEFDEKGNVVQLAKFNDIKTSYLWGYNQTLPIVHAVNVTYTNLKNALSETVLNELKGNTLTDEEVINRLIGLQDTFPEARITIYTYDPLKGITSVTDPNGNTQKYIYDDLQRLKVILDRDGKKISEYDYHYVP